MRRWEIVERSLNTLKSKWSHICRVLCSVFCAFDLRCLRWNDFKCPLSSSMMYKRWWHFCFCHITLWLWRLSIVIFVLFSTMALTLIKNNKGGGKLCYNGFTFTKKSSSKTSIHWECSQRKAYHCKGTVNTDLQVSKLKSLIGNCYNCYLYGQGRDQDLVRGLMSFVLCQYSPTTDWFILLFGLHV